MRSPIRADFEVYADDSVQRWLDFYALMHHIEEVARHAGHADIIRKAIDGSTGE